MATALVKVHLRAITLYQDPDGSRASWLQILKSEGHRRAAATALVCDTVLWAFEEGAELILSRINWQVFGGAVDYIDRSQGLPSYTELRSYLIGELDADPILACQRAMRHIASRNRRYRRDDNAFTHGRERGWL